MTGVHGLQQVQHFAATHFTDDDAVGAHAQAVAQQIANADVAAAIKTAGAAFQSYHMVVVECQFGGVFDGHNAFAGGDKAGQCVEQRGLARAGAAADQNIAPRLHCHLQNAANIGTEGAKLHQLDGRKRVFAELADGDRGAVNGQRFDDDVDTTAIRQTCIHHGAGLIEPPTQGRENAANNAQHMLIVFEMHVLTLKHASA